jgi:WD40 repeat protein
MTCSRRFLLVALTVAVNLPAIAQEPPATTPDGFPFPPGAIRRFGNRQLRHPSGITMAAISPDGKLLATASVGEVVVWDLKTLTVKRSFPDLSVSYATMTSRGGGLAFLPDSISLLVGVRPEGSIPASDLELAQVWDVQTGKKKFGIKGRYDYYATAWPTTGGKQIVVLANTGTGSSFHFFDARDGKELLTVPTSQVGNLPWVGQAGNVAALQGPDQNGVTVLDVPSGKELLSFTDKAVEIALSRDGKMLVWVDPTGTVHVHDLETKKEKFTFTHPEKDRPGPMVISADNKTLYFSSNHGRLFRWDLANNKKGPDFGNRHNFWSLTALVVNPEETTLFSMSNDHLIKRWDLKTGKELHMPEGYTTHLAQVMAADRKHLILTDHEGQVDYWDLATGKQVKQLQKPHQGGINWLAESADGKWLAGGRTSQDVRLFDLTTGKVVRDIPLSSNADDKWNDQVQRVAFDPAGTVLYCTSEKTGVTAWEMPSGKRVWNTPGNGSLLAVDPKGRWLALGGGFNRDPVKWTLVEARTGTASRVDVEPIEATGRIGGFRYPPYVADLAWLPDGSRMISIHYDGTIRLWDPDARKESRRLTIGQSGRNRSLGVSADGRWLAVGESNHSVAVTELATGKKALALGGHDSGVIQVAFTRDGWGLVSNADLSPVLWALCPKDLPNTGQWEALASDDAEKAYKAQWALLKNPAAAVKLFGEQIKPAEVAISRDQFDKWVTGLDNPQFRARDAAEKALTAAGGKVPVGWLRKALADVKTDEPRARLTRILTHREKEPDPNAWRLSRAVQVLELAGTDEARALLKAWSAVNGSPLADDAKESLARMTK